MHQFNNGDRAGSNITKYGLGQPVQEPNKPANKNHKKHKKYDA
jgi:hypothetical protein